jgi:hypothetical protein
MFEQLQALHRRRIWSDALFDFIAPLIDLIKYALNIEIWVGVLCNCYRRLS